MNKARIEKLKAAVDAHIIYDVTAQVDREFKEQTAVAEDIENGVMEKKLNNEDDVEIFQWHSVTEPFADAAKNAGEVIVETPFGMIWGRQTCMQDICLDHNVQDIFESMNAI